MPIRRHPIRPARLAGGIAAAAALALAGPAAASACSPGPLTQTLKSLNDAAWYAPVQNHSFENGKNDWDLTNALVVSGADPWKTAGSGDDSSLRLNAGGVAENDAACVTLDSPTFRYFAKPSSTKGSLGVDLLWHEDGRDWTVRAATLSAGSSTAWRLSPITPLAGLVTTLSAHDDDELVHVRFTNLGAGTWDLDDVLNDPYRRG